MKKRVILPLFVALLVVTMLSSPIFAKKPPEELLGPFGAVWDYYCGKSDVPAGLAWLREVKDYEANVTSKRQ